MVTVLMVLVSVLAGPMRRRSEGVPAAHWWKCFVVRSRSLLPGPLAPWYYYGIKVHIANMDDEKTRSMKIGPISMACSSGLFLRY